MVLNRTVETHTLHGHWFRAIAGKLRWYWQTVWQIFQLFYLKCPQNSSSEINYKIIYN